MRPLALSIIFLAGAVLFSGGAISANTSWVDARDARETGAGVMWISGILFAGQWIAEASDARRRKKGSTKNTCAKCGYNLTGNVSGVCPEWGQKTE